MLRKYASMTRRCHNNTLQTNPLAWQCEEDIQNTNSFMTLKGNKSKATGSLFPSEMIAKLETALSTAQQNNDHTQNPHKTTGAIMKYGSITTEAQP